MLVMSDMLRTLFIKQGQREVLIKKLYAFLYYFQAGCYIKKTKSINPMKKRILLIVLMVFTFTGLFAQTATQPSGSGTSTNPYQIATLDNLYWISQNSGSWNSWFIQTADIDASATSGWNGGAGFPPIGGSFWGTYDGQGHSISSLTISVSGSDQVGLFKTLRGTLKNLKLVTSTIVGHNTVGAFVGYNWGATVRNCHFVSGTVTGNEDVGGIAGLTNYGFIYESCNSGTVNGVLEVGGIAGKTISTSKVENCYNNGTVDGTSGTDGWIGGLIGLLSGDLKYSYNVGSVNGPPYRRVYALTGDSYGSITDCFYLNSYSNPAGGSSKTTTEMKTQSTYTNWDFTNIWAISSSENGGYPYLRWALKVTSQDVSNIQPTSVTGNGNITHLGLSDVVAHGICWNLASAGTPPTIADGKADGGFKSATGAFTVSATGLSEGTNHKARAYATDRNGTTVYGDEVSFTTNRNQTISFNSLPSKAYGDADFSISATASSGLTVIFTSTNTSVATVTGNTIHILSPGTTTIKANQAGDATYLPAPEVSQTLTVNKATLTVTADNKTVTYGDAKPTLTYTMTGFVNSETEAGVVTGSPSLTTTYTNTTSVASSPVTITSAIGTLAATNYSFSFVNGTVTINKKGLTVTAHNKTVTYGDTKPTLTYTMTGFINSETEASAVTGTPSLTTAYTVTTPVASSPVTITSATGTLAATNYSFSFVDGAVTINKKGLTVTADNKTVTYGDAKPTLTHTMTGFVNSETEAGVVTGSPSLATVYTVTTPVASGPVTITATNGDLSSANYSFTSVNGTITINRKQLTVTAGNKTVTYGDITPILTYTMTGFVNSETEASVVTGTPSLTTAYINTTQVASSPVTITSAIGTLAAANYSFSFVNGAVTINKKNLTVTADNKSRFYGDNNPALTVSYSGWVNSESATVLNTAPTATTSATSASNVGPYTIVPDNGADDNYSFTYVNGTLTINKATPMLAVTNSPVTYNGQAQAATVTVTNYSLPVAGTLTLKYDGSTTVPTNAKTYTLTADFTPGDLANFNSINNGAVGNFTINKVVLTVTADNKTVTYGDAKPTLTYTLTGFVNSETEAGAVTGSPSLTTAYTVTTPVVSSPVNIISVIGTLAATNYSFTFVNGTITINKKELTVTTVDKTVTYGDAKPTLTYNMTGFVNSETEASAVTGSPSLTTAYSNTTPVASSPVTITSATGTLAAANYNFTLVNGIVTINKKNLTVTSDNKTVTYGDTKPTLTYTMTGFVNSETEAGVISGAPSLATAYTNTTPVVSSPVTITTANGTLSAANYSFSFVNGAVTINRKTLTYTADNKTKEYDGNVYSPFTTTITGFVNNETVGEVSGTLTYSGTGPAAVNAGTYTIVPDVTSLSAANYSFSPVNAQLVIQKATPTLRLMLNTPAPYTGYAQQDLIIPSVSGVISDEKYNGLTTGAKDAGSYSVTADFTPTDLINYNTLDNAIAGTYIINKAILTITAGNKNKIYGGENPALTILVEGLLYGEDTSVIDIFPTVSCQANAASNAGAYPIIPANGADNNYSFVYKNGTLTIQKAELTTTADNKSRGYKEPNPEFSFSYSGLKNNEDASSIDIAPFASTTADESSLPGTYEITVSGGSDNNYTFNYKPGTLTITPGTASITLDGLLSTYDGKPKPVTVITDPEGLTVDVKYNESISVPVNAGTYTVTATVSSSQFTGSVTKTLIIQKAPVTINFDKLDFVHDGQPKTVTISTNVQGILPVITYDGSSVAPSAVGTYKVVATVSTENYEGSVTGELKILSDNDKDGIADINDPDDDNDGLSDEVEATKGTNPFNKDTDGDGIIDPDDSTPTIPTSSEENLQNLQFRVFPTVTSGLVHVELPGSDFELTVLSINGKITKVINKVSGKTTIDLTGNAPGIYLVRVNDGKQIAVKQVVMTR